MTATSPTMTNFLDRLNGVRRSGDGWVAQCPCRDDDKSPSLSVVEGRDGRVLAKCHRGGSACSLDEICESIELTVRDLHPYQEKKSEFVDGELTNTYGYYDGDGELVFQVLRFALPDGRKEFRQRVKEGSGWKYSTTHLSEKPLYNLPAVLDAVANGRPVFIVEGEKDADSLIAIGLTATCNPQGADNGQGSKWKPNHTAALQGARIAIIADNDEPGRIHADYVANELVAVGCTVKIKHAPEPHKDVSDLLKAGGDISELVEDEVREPDPFVPVLSNLQSLLDKPGTLEERLAEARKILSISEEVPPGPKVGRLVNWGEFVNETKADPYDWLIDGLLERQERVVIVAAEGVGKTTLARQIAICAGAGVHPFTYMEIPPIRTLFVDLENPERIIRRQARKLVESLRINYGKRPGEADLYTKPDGINILNTKDRELLERQIVKTDAQLLVLGPIYKSYIDPGNRSSTALITEVCTYFDYLRDNYGVTLWLEHHAPLGNALTGRDMRPADSAVWMRWPEFGFGITRDPTTMEKEYEWKGFREPRDERNFPLRMKRGTIMPFEVISFRSSMT